MDKLVWAIPFAVVSLRFLAALAWPRLRTNRGVPVSVLACLGLAVGSGAVSAGLVGVGLEGGRGERWFWVGAGGFAICLVTLLLDLVWQHVTATR